MRGLKRQKQSVYYSKVSETLSGIDTVEIYSKPKLYHFSVSATAGTPEEIAAGIIPDYDRYITSFYKDFNPSEGDVFWIDTTPILDENGNLKYTGEIPSLESGNLRLNNAYPTLSQNGTVVLNSTDASLDSDGCLIVEDSSYLPIPPDYRLKRIIQTKKGNVMRCGIVKIGGNVNE